MYRLLIYVLTMIFCVSIQPVLASDTVVELGKPVKASLEVIGKKPPKRFIELELGDLRKGGARLPDGERDLKARIRLRNRRALERLREGPKPKRKDRKKGAKAKSSGSDKNEKEAKEDEAGKDKDEEDKAESKKAEKKVARASKKKRKKKKKKKASKRNGGGSAKRSTRNANPTRDAKIE